MRNSTFFQFIKFIIVGTSNTGISYLLNITILLGIQGFCWRYDYIVANVIAFTLSFFWAFYWNNRVVFSIDKESKRDIKKAFGRSFLVYGFTGYILNNILSSIWINWLEVSKYIAPLLNLIISVPTNYCLNKLWAFNSKS